MSGATNWSAIGMFAIFVAFTLGITAWAARRTKTRADFYAAGGGVSASERPRHRRRLYVGRLLLGISSQIFGFGYDGLIYRSAFCRLPVILCRWRAASQSGALTLPTSPPSLRADPRPLLRGGLPPRRALLPDRPEWGRRPALQLLFGLPYLYAVVIVGVLMTLYVLFGGMIATTWVQIIKAVLLLGCATFMALAVLYQFGFSPEALFARAVEVKAQVAVANGKAAAEGLRIMGPGTFLTDPVSAISLGIALMFGTAGLPHILMRFFTVPDARQARISVLWATGWTRLFLILTSSSSSARSSWSHQPAGWTERARCAAAIWPPLHLAEAIGGNLFLGFVSAVAFATILAVVAGLTLSGASAVSHDLYASVFRRGSQVRRGLRVSRWTVAYSPCSRSAWRGIPEDQCRLHGEPRLRDRRIGNFPC